MITIVDYGLGNIFSVERSLDHCGAKEVKISSDPEEIFNSDKIILPGVGAFRDGMQGLKDRNLIEPIKNAALQGKPILGICLGMQMLVSSSMEFGDHDGLDLISGQVVPILENQAIKKDILKIPYIGWAKLDINIKHKDLKSPLSGVRKNSYVYLVHSYHVQTKDSNDTNGIYNYDGINVTAAIQKNNVIGFQFHPEKSGEVGMGIIKNFISL